MRFIYWKKILIDKLGCPIFESKRNTYIGKKSRQNKLVEFIFESKCVAFIGKE